MRTKSLLLGAPVLILALENGASPARAAEDTDLTDAGHKPGVRPPRIDTVTITDIQSNKVPYDENENATAKVTLINSRQRAWKAVRRCGM